MRKALRLSVHCPLRSLITYLSPRPLGAKFILDLLLWTLATTLAYMLRLDRRWLEYGREILVMCAIGILIKAAMICVLGFHRQSWRRVSFPDLYGFRKSIAFVSLSLATMPFLLRPHLSIPRSVPVIDGLLALLLLGGGRFTGRFFYDLWLRLRANGQTKQAMIIGAGETGTMMTRELLAHPHLGLRPVGYLDDDANKHGQILVDLKVLGSIDHLGRVASWTQADEVVIAISPASVDLVRNGMSLFQPAKIKRRIASGVFDLISSKLSAT